MRSAGQIFLCGLLTAALPLRVHAQELGIEGSAVDVDINGNMYVLDAERNTLRLFDRTGRVLREVGGPGWLDGQFDRPAAVWARNGIDVFVADYGNHRIERFDRSLDFVSSFSTRESGDPDVEFGYPTGVALSRLGELFICDTENSRIVKVDRFSTVERTFGGIGGGKGRLVSPVKVEAGPKDAIYVLDGRRVAVFDAFGNYLRDLPSPLRSRPSVLYADDNGIAVLDSEALCLFDRDERVIGSFSLSAIVSPGMDIRALAIQGGTIYLLTGGGLVKIPDPRVSSNIENKSISH
jgi:DNA-binding beta-propeller fold protein YncE